MVKLLEVVFRLRVKNLCPVTGVYIEQIPSSKHGDFLEKEYNKSKETKETYMLTSIQSAAMIFNTRELSIILWAFLFFTWMIVVQKSNLPSLFFNLIKTIATMWKVVLPMIGYVLGTVFLLQQFSIWNTDLIKVTIFWFFGWAFILFLNSPKIAAEKGYLKKIIRELVGLAAIISFIVHFYSFSIWIELMLVPLFVMLGGLLALTELSAKYKNVNIFLSAIAGILVLLFLVASIYKTVVNWNNFVTVSTLQEFLVPIILSLMFIPFAYGLSLYNKWEQKKIWDTFLKRKNEISKK